MSATLTLPPNSVADGICFSSELMVMLPRLRSFALSIVRNANDADDLVQETLLRAWAARDRFAIGTNMRAWTFTILKRVYLSQLRKRRLITELDDDTQQMLVVTENQSASVTLDEVGRAMTQLSENQRAALSLIVFEGLPYEQAAARIGVPVGTLKSRVTRARQALTVAMNRGVTLRDRIALSVETSADSDRGIARLRGDSAPSRVAGRKPMAMPPPLTSLPITLKPDPSRTVIRPLDVGYPEGLEDGRPQRPLVVAKRVLAMSRIEAEELIRQVIDIMDDRHGNVEDVFYRRYHELDADIRALPASDPQRLLLGAVFSQEYAFEAAALFNPSIVVDPGADCADGDTPFILSLRGVGEGHISSITFRTGRWRRNGEVVVDAPSARGVPPFVAHRFDGGGAELVCCDSADISETVLFPVMPSQKQGVEDLRLVQFTDDDGSSEIVGTYTAFDGKAARSELLRGIDFRTVRMSPLAGRMAGYKGMALFPRRIDGQYVMLGRQDNERIWLLRSDDMHRWDEGVPIMAPRYPWEWVQLGNCGSPIEIDEGWLVLTHGVGILRAYCIGACLLDKRDPTRVLARTPEPLLTPKAEHHGGYVPNVVYGCGMIARGRDVLIPYAVGDQFATFAAGTVDAILGAMTSEIEP